MSLSKPLFSHLKSLTLTRLPLRPLSFATPDTAAADRRRRKRQVRIEPPLRRSQSPNTNTSPKLPETPAALAAKRLDLHNDILKLIRKNDLDEAALLIRHSIYSNCRPTVFTCNAVLNAQLRQLRYNDILSLHRFLTQASITPTVLTYNILIQVYCDARKTDIALEHYRLLINSSVSPSPTTFRILTRGLVDNNNVAQAIEIKDEMPAPDPIVYNTIMSGLVKSTDPEDHNTVISLYNELMEKVGGAIGDGAVYGNVMKGYFLKGMEEEAMEVYKTAMASVRFNAVSYNSVLEALTKNGRLEEAIVLFERMVGEHEAPRRVTVNLGSFNVMVDGFCEAGRFGEAVEVFRRMGGMKCSADAVSWNNLICQLGRKGLVAEAEEVYMEMDEGEVKPDEYTYVLLVEACFEVDRVEDATAYFRKMIELGLRPTAAAYNKVIGGLLNVGRIDEAGEFFDIMVEKEVNPNLTSYELMARAYVEAGRLDDTLKKVKGVVMDNLTLSDELKELVDEALKKDGRDELEKLVEGVEREKAEAAALAAEEKARAEALATAEEERKRAEAAAKKEASDRSTKMQIEAILKRNQGQESEGETPAIEAPTVDEIVQEEDTSDSHPVEVAELVTAEAAEETQPENAEAAEEAELVTAEAAEETQTENAEAAEEAEPDGEAAEQVTTTST